MAKDYELSNQAHLKCIKDIENKFRSGKISKWDLIHKIEYHSHVIRVQDKNKSVMSKERKAREYQKWKYNPTSSYFHAVWGDFLKKYANRK